MSNMANWAITDYVIEGPTETLQKIEEAIKHHPVQEGSHKDWEGNIIIAFRDDINWKPSENRYMRGFIQQDSVHFDGIILRFVAEEAWGVTDFDSELKEIFPDIKVYWETEEPDEEVYATNDSEGKYFKDRFYIDTCIEGNYESEYFAYESDLYKWLYKITDGKINTKKKVELFNEQADKDESEDYIHIYEFKVVK